LKPAAALLSDDIGQGLGEYALILGLIATVCLAAVVLIGSSIQSSLHKISTAL
jgi:Flp pilus assembly pilin Flp